MAVAGLWGQTEDEQKEYVWRLHTNRSDDFGTKTAQHRRLKEMAKMAEFPRGNVDNIYSLLLLLDIWKDYCILCLCLVLLLITIWSLVGGKSLNSWKSRLECRLKWKCWNSHEFLLLFLWLPVRPKNICHLSCSSCKSAATLWHSKVKMSLMPDPCRKIGSHKQGKINNPSHRFVRGKDTPGTVVSLHHHNKEHFKMNKMHKSLLNYSFSVIFSSAVMSKSHFFTIKSCFMTNCKCTERSVLIHSKSRLLISMAT